MLDDRENVPNAYLYNGHVWQPIVYPLGPDELTDEAVETFGYVLYARLGNPDAPHSMSARAYCLRPGAEKAGVYPFFVSISSPAPHREVVYCDSFPAFLSLLHLIATPLLAVWLTDRGTSES
jgi:hypothetical protein